MAHGRIVEYSDLADCRGIDLNQGLIDRPALAVHAMGVSVVFRCPNTGLNVQGWVADDPTEGEAEAYEAVTCTACTRMHVINLKTGKMLGDEED